MDAIVEKVEKLVQTIGEDELSSRRIGEAVMDELKLLDEVAQLYRIVMGKPLPEGPLQREYLLEK